MHDISTALVTAVAYHQAGRLAEASQLYQQILAVDPTNVDALHLFGLTASSAGDYDTAIDAIRRAIQLRPAEAVMHFNLGVAFQNQGNLNEAVASYHHALRFNHDYEKACNNLGNVFRELGRLQDAEENYERAISINQNCAYAHNARSTLWLLKGDFQRGWAEHEWRWEGGEIPQKRFSRPRWHGESVEAKTVLIWAEQGLGDTIQFVRYAAMVKKRGARVIFDCQKPLQKLLSSHRGIDQLAGDDAALLAFDFHMPLLSLPLVFGTRLETIPADVPYLFANETLVAEWRGRLSHVRGLKVGIAWQGSTTYRDDRKRSIGLQHFSTLANRGVSLISLQKGDGIEQLAEFRHRVPIIELGDFDTQHGAFMDSAAIMMTLDLVITSDTSVAHLAGALGVAVWVALPYVPDWRWLLDRSDSPWYPTMRLFRQKQPGDWIGVFQEIETALRQKFQDTHGSMKSE